MNIKFFYQPFQKKQFWSNKSHKYYLSDNIQDQVWDSPEQPCKGECLVLHDIIPRLTKNATKATRSAIMRFPLDIFPLKEYIGYDKWNGIIFIDLDLIKSKLFCEKIDAVIENDKLVSYSKDKNDKFYSALQSILCNINSENFYYIERSSSYVGVHIMFYFDVEKTRDNFFRCAEFCKDFLMSKISNNEYGIINDFDKIISDHKVFDGIYNRIYQKCYITGIEAYINDFVTGEIDDSILSEYKVKEEIRNTVKSTYKISNRLSKIKDGIYDVDHNNRFYIYTALKKVTKSKEECNAIWAELCKKFKLYRDYTYNKFVNEFDYDSIDESTAYVNILERYGFNIKKGETYYHLNENQYLSDIKNELLNNVVTGVNLWRSPTGSGKTFFWTDLNANILSDILFGINTIKPILIVEPLNSIIDTKYNKEVVTVTGSKQFPKELNNYTMYVTNYNKLLRKIGTKFELRPDIEEFFKKFEYIIIDESHIIIKDSFRCDVLIPFINTIQNISKSCKIILQTASPMDEDLLFNIKNKVIITKKPKADIKYITRISENDKFCIQDLTDITKYYISQGRKVYIYWNNASLNQLRSFKYTYDDPDKVAIYHKRNKGEESMNRISKWHLLEKHDCDDNYAYDVLLSSVYFGVGNDLDDKCKAAVIIVGNNTVQEDIQAIGRWRNSDDIEVCQIILKKEYDFIKYTNEIKLNRNRIWGEEQDKLKKMWKDRSSKSKSVMIFNKSYQITNESDIKPLSIMKSAEIYYSAFAYKIAELEDPYYNIRCKHDIDRILEINTDLNDATKEYWKSVKEIRNSVKRDIVTGKIEYDIINKDSNIERFNRLWKKLKVYGVDKILDLKYICSNNNYNALNLWVKYYSGCIGHNIDYPELYALLWYRNWYNNADEYETKDIRIIFNKEITNYDFYSILAYVIFVHNKNKGDENYRILFNYFGTFKWYCKLFSQLPEELINLFYKQNGKTDMTPTKIFFDDYTIDTDFERIIIEKLDDIIRQTEHIDNTLEEIRKVIKGCLFLLNIQRKENGKKGGEKTKQILINDSFKRPEKYNLKVGQKFDSCTDLSNYTGKSVQTVSEWMKKGWIKPT